MKFFSINKRLAPVITTIIVIISLGAIYFFVYLPHNEKTLQEQHFRALKTIDENIHSKVENSVALLNNLIRSYNPQRKDTAGINNYISRYPKDKFILTPISQIPQAKDTNSNTYEVLVSNRNKQIILVRDTAGSEIQMKFTLEQFISSLLPAEVFDEYIVFSNQIPIYETFPSGLKETKNDSLLGTKNGIRASGIKKLTISGQDYQLFLQPVNFDSGNEWIVAGLLTNKNYQKEKNQLPSEIVILLVILAGGIILLFPWIKLFHMGNKDRLTIRDGISSIVISMLFMSLLFFTFFNYNRSFRPDDSRHSKDVLATKISSSFKDEIHIAYDRLRYCDSLFNLGSVTYLDTDIIFLNKTPAYYPSQKQIEAPGDSVSIRDAAALNNISDHLLIKQLFWLSKTGNEIHNWTTDSILPPHGNFSARDYFKKIKDDNPYFLDNTPLKKFYVDQVVSWTTGSFTTVLSIPSRSGGTVAAISFGARSFENVVLPAGYSFVVVNDNGKVLYHSQSFRNLNENLLNEFSNKEALQSNLIAHSEANFSTDYFGTKYTVKIMPLGYLPYSLIILEDKTYSSTRDAEIFSFTFSMLFLFFVFLVLKMLFIFLVSAKRSFFKKQLLDTSWIGPKEFGEDEYVISSVMNIIIIFFLIIYFSFPSFLTYLFLLIFSAIFISLFLNFLFAKQYKEKKPEHYKYKLYAMRCLVVMIIVLDLIACLTLCYLHVIFLFVHEIVIGFIGIGIYYARDWVYKKVTGIKKRWGLCWKHGHVYCFTFMVISRLIITSGIPVVFFYISSYNYEQNISTRYRQSVFIHRILDKLALDRKGPIQKDTAGIYSDKAWISYYEFNQKEIPVKPYLKEEKRAVELLSLFRLSFTREAIAEERFNDERSNDSLFSYNHLLNEAGRKGDTTTYRLHNDKAQTIKVASSNLNYKFPTPFELQTNLILNGSFFWALLLLALITFYFIIYNIIKKLFALGVPDLKKLQVIDDEILEDNELNHLLFVLGPPGAIKKELIKRKIKEGKIKGKNNELLVCDMDDQIDTVVIADMIYIPDSNNEEADQLAWKNYSAEIFAPKNKLVIVNHFEYNVQDSIANRIKLNFLEKLMVDGRRKIIILSTIHPVAFLDSAFIEAQKKNAPKTDDGKKDEKSTGNAKSIPGEDLERWHVLLGHYRIILKPLSYQADSENVTSWEKMICAETKWGNFLNQLRKPVTEATKKMIAEKEIAPVPDELAFKLQMTSHYFYMYIWQSLTQEEKFLLYDLAEDNLVNSFDDYNLSMLIAKGIITWDQGTLRLFNKGFRNFILTAIGNSEAMKIKEQIRDNGSWGRLRAPLIIVILAIFAFLLASQEETYTKLITYVAALAAGIPAFTRIFSLFDRNTQKPA